MQAMILAAGLGSRLGLDYPKCMVEIGGQPILQRVIAWLRGWGITNFMINLHHKPQVVLQHFGDGTDYGVSITYSMESTLLGTAGAVKNVTHWFEQDKPFIVYYGDNLCYINLAEMLARHRQTQALVTVATHLRRDVSNSGLVRTDTWGRVIQFQEKSTRGPGLVNAGIYIAEPRLLDIMPDTYPLDFGQAVFPSLLRHGYTIVSYVLDVDERMYWIDTPEDLEDARTRWRMP